MNTMQNTTSKARIRLAPAPYSHTRKGAIPRTALIDEFGYTASCPICGKRVFDLTDLPGTTVQVRMKCPHCRKIVKIPFLGASP
jgi:hypothetical protein